jgi:C1A family cysteine protease
MTDASIIAWLNVRPLMIYVTASTWSPYSPNANGRTFSCLNSDSISTSTLNHAVLLVGYTDTEWIIKNSWGASWGSYGYIYVTRDTNYDCGIGFFVGTLQ